MGDEQCRYVSYILLYKCRYLPEELDRVVVWPVPLVLGMLLPELDVKFGLSRHCDLQLGSCEQPQNLSSSNGQVFVGTLAAQPLWNGRE